MKYLTLLPLLLIGCARWMIPEPQATFDRKFGEMAQDIGRSFKEAFESYEGSSVQVNYWITERPYSKSEVAEAFVRNLVGGIDAGYTKEHYAYSSWTEGHDYDSSLSVGGHDILGELQSQIGKFIIIELNFKYP